MSYGNIVCKLCLWNGSQGWSSKSRIYAQCQY